MPEQRLTKAEKDALLDRALREKVRRREANRKAREARVANGRRRIEKTVPALFLPEIRRIVTAVLAAYEAGREPRLRRIEPVSPAEPVMPHASREAPPRAAPPPNARGLGPAGRRRAQAAHRRERQRAAGRARTTFEVPAELVPGISGLVDRMVAWMSEGAQVILEAGPAATETAIPDPAPEPNLPQGAVARVLDDLMTLEDDRGENCPLFDDVQAAARIDWGSEGAGARTGVIRSPGCSCRDGALGRSCSR